MVITLILRDSAAVKWKSRENREPHWPPAACELQQELLHPFLFNTHKAFDNTVTPPECAVNCRGSVKCFTNDCFAVKAVFSFQWE